MRVPMLILALVAAPLLSHDAQAQWWNGKSEVSHQNNKDKDKLKDNNKDKSKHDDVTPPPPPPPAPAPSGGTISGTVFNDLNNDMSLNAGEAGLPGWTITLSGGVAPVTTTTGMTGSYSFTGVLPGAYSVCATATAGWAQTSQPRCWTAYIIADFPNATFAGFDFGAGAI